MGLAMPMVDFLVENVGPLAIQAAAQAVRNMPVRTPESPPEGDQPEGCPMCQVHADLAESERLLAGMMLTADAQGRIPRHMASTILLVDQHLRLAQDKLDAVASARPDLGIRTQDLRTCLETTRAALPAREAIDLPTARSAHTAVETCWRNSVSLADLYFGPRPASPLDQVRQVLLELPQADRERFISSLRP
jgi:hypothetical protein